MVTKEKILEVNKDNGIRIELIFLVPGHEDKGTYRVSLRVPTNIIEDKEGLQKSVEFALTSVANDPEWLNQSYTEFKQAKAVNLKTIMES